MICKNVNKYIIVKCSKKNSLVRSFKAPQVCAKPQIMFSMI